MKTEDHIVGFTQITFLFAFLPVSILIYLAAYKFSARNIVICNIVLVCESLIFLWWAEPTLLLWFVALTIVMYLLGKRIEITKAIHDKKIVMICTVLFFVSLPILYKYIPSLSFPVEDGISSSLPMFNDVIVPIGISFFALEAISYIADIYIGIADAGSIIDVFVYMLLFPKFVCGPIVLWRDIHSQLNSRKIKLGKVSDGLKRIILGYGKKAIIADTFYTSIALIDVKMATNSTDSLTVWILGLLYYFRIYYDLSGYSDIAIGLCNIFGFDIIENFDKPYLSSSITDFWRRWHISLHTWLKEYIYIPIGGNRSAREYLNILITFLIAGFWHGWKVNILIWALLNGMLVVSDKLLSSKEWYQRIPLLIKIIATMIIVILGWLLFRAPGMGSATNTFKALFISHVDGIPNFTWHFFMTRRTTVLLLIAAAGAFGVFDKAAKKINAKIGEKAYDMIEKIVLLMLFALSIVFVIASDYTPFIFAVLQ